MALNTASLADSLIEAGQAAFKRSWNRVKNFAVPEFQKIAQTLVDIELGMLRHPPLYSKKVAETLFRMQLRASQMVLTATVGMVINAIEAGINAALAAIAGVVNRAIGFELIVPRPA